MRKRSAKAATGRCSRMRQRVDWAIVRSPLSAAISAAVASTIPSLGAAQEVPIIEVLIVTATRREESIQDIPINIAAFDGELLEEREIGDLAELGRNVPGLYTVDQGKRTSNRVVVRGLNLDTVNASEGIGNNAGGTVSTYLGEIPLYVDLSMADIDRVEVLLGPQGTLYGSGTLGGAIRYIPRKPELDVSDATFRASTFDLAESDGYGFHAGATFNFPLGDSLALRATIDRYDDPGFIDTPFLLRDGGVSDPEPDFTNAADVAANLYGDEDVNGEDTLYGRFALRWQPSDAVDATFTYHHQNMEVFGRQQNHRVAFGTGNYVSATRFPEPNDRTNELLSAEIIADLGFAELTSATGFSQYDERGQRDQTDLLITLEYYYETFPSFSAFTREDLDEETLSQEIRLVSQGDGRWTWIAGLFYLDQETDEISREFTPRFDEFLGISRPDNLEYISREINDLTEKAVFGEVGFEITDRWEITLGGRYYDYDLKTLSGATTPLFNTFDAGLPPDEIGLELDFYPQSDDGFLYKVNTSYQFTDDVMGYVTVSEGYRIGGTNGIALCPDPLPDNQIVCSLPSEFQFFPDTTTNFEVGVRSQWLDQRLTFNAAVYFVDWQDPQLTSATVNGAQPYTKNGEGAESKGIEIGLDVLATDRLSIGFSLSHASSELSDPAPDLLRLFVPPGFGPGAGYDGLDAEFIDGLPGDRLPGAPEIQGTFNIGYEMPLNGSWGLDLSYGFSAIGDVITKTGLRAGGETLGGYTVHFASATFTSGPWTLGVYGQNLLDKYAVTGVRSTPLFVQTVTDAGGVPVDPVRARSYAHDVLRPREIGFRFSYDLELVGRRN
jgi:iron complex outermembrane recepter protein